MFDNNLKAPIINVVCYYIKQATGNIIGDIEPLIMWA